jgi:hypothetical protein
MPTGFCMRLSRNILIRENERIYNKNIVIFHYVEKICGLYLHNQAIDLVTMFGAIWYRLPRAP